MVCKIIRLRWATENALAGRSLGVDRQFKGNKAIFELPKFELKESPLSFYGTVHETNNPLVLSSDIFNILIILSKRKTDKCLLMLQSCYVLFL